MEVEVAITEIDAGCGRSANRVRHIFVLGYLPCGHLFEGYKARLIERLAENVTQAADSDPDSTWVAISGCRKYRGTSG